MAAAFNEQAFEQYYEAMSKNPYEVKEHTSNFIKGTIDVDEKGIFFTSIPYDKGWKITVDGKKLEQEETIAIADAFLGFPLEGGTHEIELEYTPVGFIVGRNITFIGIGIYLGCHGYHVYKRKNKRK